MTESRSLAQIVNDAFLHSLFADDEVVSPDAPPRIVTRYAHAARPTQAQAPEGVPAGAVLVEGVVNTFALHPARLEEAREQIRTVIQRMPVGFRPAAKGGGGGWSFLNLCMTKDGEQWAEHPTMNELVVLAIGLGLGLILVPREFWTVMPGGMPYVVLDDEPLAA